MLIGWGCPLRSCEAADDVTALYLEEWDGGAFVVTSWMEVNIFESITGASVAINSHHSLVTDQLIHKLLLFWSIQQGTCGTEFEARIKLNRFLDRSGWRLRYNLSYRLLILLCFLNQCLGKLIFAYDLFRRLDLVIIKVTVLLWQFLALKLSKFEIEVVDGLFFLFDGKFSLFDGGLKLKNLFLILAVDKLS